MKVIINNFVIAILILILLSGTAYTVDVMYWDSDFDPIALANITSQAQTQQGSATITLFTNGNTELSADNTATAQFLEDGAGTDTLVTEYRLSFDGDGSSATGRADTSYETYDSFLSTPVAVTYVTDDNDVDVTLWVRASNTSDNVANSGLYNATQTLTVSWVGP